MDEAKFGKRKYNKGAYREGQWVLGAVDRNTGHCFLLPCPNNKRDALTLLPLIQRWILPGSVVYTDEWAAYNGLTAATYTHHSVNHSIQFVDPDTGVHTNTQEGLWAHVKKSVVGATNLELALVDFMFRRRKRRRPQIINSTSPFQVSQLYFLGANHYYHSRRWSPAIPEPPTTQPPTTQPPTTQPPTTQPPTTQPPTTQPPTTQPTPPSPPSPTTQPTTEREPSPTPRLSAILPPPALSESSAGPIRRRRHTTKMNDLESEIHEEYGRVLLAVNNGSSIKKSLPNLSIGRTSWYNWRYFAEMKLVDVDHYLHLKEQFTTSGGLCNACKGCLIDGLFMAKAEEMRREKKLLPLV
ncbi:hypothetical protein ACHWQZ_G017402 [Mnemiopsis leidyi]